MAIVWGRAPLASKETFRESALSLDVTILYAVMLLCAGAIVSYVARRQRQLLQQL